MNSSIVKLILIPSMLVLMMKTNVLSTEDRVPLQKNETESFTLNYDEIYIEVDQDIGTISFVDENLLGTVDPNINLQTKSTRWIGQSIKQTELPQIRRSLAGKPQGQPTYGYDKSTAGGSVFFFDYGGSTVNVTVSVNVGGKWFNGVLAVQTGKISGSGSGYAVEVPSGKSNFLYAIQDHRITPTRVDYYVGGAYRNTHITYKSHGYSLSWEWRKS